MDLLKLGALDEQDLQAISANMQDAVMRIGDIKYLAAKKQFAILANRFNWESVNASAAGYQRRRSGLHACLRLSRVLSRCKRGKASRNSFERTDETRYTGSGDT